MRGPGHCLIHKVLLDSSMVRSFGARHHLPFRIVSDMMSILLLHFHMLGQAVLRALMHSCRRADLLVLRLVQLCGRWLHVLLVSSLNQAGLWLLFVRVNHVLYLMACRCGLLQNDRVLAFIHVIQRRQLPPCVIRDSAWTSMQHF